MMKIVFLFYLLANFLYSADIIVYMEPEEITIAALVNLTISVENIGSGVPDYPDLSPKENEYFIKDIILSGNSVTYILQFWEVGNIEIAPIPIMINYRDEESVIIETDLIKLDILPTLKNIKSDIKIIKDMYEINLFRPIVFLFCILSLVIASFISFKLWKKKRKTELIPNTTLNHNIPPHNMAIDKINNLVIPRKITAESTESFYLAITRIFRNYINNILFVKATEMTTIELNKYFYSQGINKELAEEWFQLFQKADIAKFAGKMPDIKQFNEDKNSYIQLIKKFNYLKAKHAIAG